MQDLCSILVARIEHPHTSLETYSGAYSRLGISCPGEFLELDSVGLRGGFLREHALATWNLHSPSDILDPELMALMRTSQTGRVAVVHCYETTYICLVDGRYEKWNVDSCVSWDASGTLRAILDAYLQS